MRIRVFLFACVLMLTCMPCRAQERLVPLQYGPSAPVSARAVKTATQTLSLPFFDDFSNYEGVPAANRWVSHGGWVDKSFAANPPTVGMLTLDAINAEGVLYGTGASTLPFPADTVVSHAIRLDSLQLPLARSITVADSVALSFWYLPGGGSGDMWQRSGDSPDVGDSLVVEFYDPTTQRWDMVWATDGINVDSLMARTGQAWQYVYIPINQGKYLHKDFRFRFRNYCSLDNIVEAGYVGNCDQWHIDYVYLDYNRAKAYYYNRDVAFVAPAPSLLRNYQAMPARQYRASEMVSRLSMSITNRFQEELSAHYVYYEDDGYINPYDGGVDNVAPYLFTDSYQTAESHARPAVSGVFPEDGVQRCYHITHIVTEGVGGDAFSQNDTLRFDQHIEDYYAYDDGSAENGYGVYASSGKVDMAVRFTLNEPDTLSVVSICFNRTRNAENEQMMFYICIWDDDGGRPGNLIYRDAVLRRPQFDGVNGFVRFVLAEAVEVKETIYVGIEQLSSGIINMGMDRNNDASQNTFYNVGGVWKQSFLAGALMMRPYFGIKATMDIATVQQTKPLAYPNPASHVITVDGVSPSAVLQLYTTGGRMAAETTGNTLYVAGFPAGVYLLRVIDNGHTHNTKVIVRP